LIVIAIIGLLATLAIVSLTGAQRKARDTKRVADAKQYQGAIELFYNKYNEYPDPANWAAFVANDTSITTTAASGGIGEFITQAPAAPDNDASDYYAYSNNSASQTSGDATQYVFVVSKLEDNNPALSGDDDTKYLSTTTTDHPGWANADFATSVIYSVSSPDAFATCEDGSGPYVYCVSE
ncbi:MAG: type II secretion system protein, partial [Patescibacteria group bacterium]